MAPEQPRSDKELMERNPNLLKLSRCFCGGGCRATQEVGAKELAR